MDRLKRIVEDLKKYGPEKIILFGSAVSGSMDEYSDIDLIVIKNTDKDFITRLGEVITYVHFSLYPVDIFVYTRNEFENMKQSHNPFIEEVLKKGKVLYEKG